LALSLASGTWKDKRNYWSVRHHFLPLEPGGWKFKTTDKRLADDPQVVATGRDAISDCGAIVLRRFIDSPDDAGGYFPLKGATKCGAALPDLAALIDGHVDLQRVVKLARALMAIDWRQWNRSGNEHAPRFPGGNNHPDEAWLAIRLACLPWKLGDFEIKAEHTMVRRLLAGDGTAAANIANRRLRSCGLRVPFDAVISDDDTAARWAAALAFPVSQSTARRAANILNPKTFGDPNA
jgi:CRISPR-associated protein Csx17